MPQTIAYMNHGRWLHNCLTCSTPLPADRQICPVCYPDAAAVLFEQVPGKAGKFRPVADAEKQGQAKAKARIDNRLNVPCYPKDRQAIERVLRERPRANMNWEPGESLQMLLEDNLKHKVKVPDGL